MHIYSGAPVFRNTFTISCPGNLRSLITHFKRDGVGANAFLIISVDNEFLLNIETGILTPNSQTNETYIHILK